MSIKENTPRIALPRGWNENVKSAMLHVISLAQFGMAYTHGWAANSINSRIRLKAKCERLQQQVSQLTEEIRIKDARMARLDARNRPHYPATERMAILLLRAAHGWSLKQTGKWFLVTPATIASWVKRLDEQGPGALLQLWEPVNKFPDFVRYAVQRLKAICPGMGKVKIAQMLCRAGLHLGKTTVDRILKEEPIAPPTQSTENSACEEVQSAERIVIANYPNHVWGLDLTTVPLFGGLWASWLPNAFPQCWPFCWRLALVVDHKSRRAMGFMIFRKPPSSQAVQKFLDRTIQKNGAKPKYIVTDKGSQFWCDGFKGWRQDQEGHAPLWRRRQARKHEPCCMMHLFRTISIDWVGRGCERRSLTAFLTRSVPVWRVIKTFVFVVVSVADNPTASTPCPDCRGRYAKPLGNLRLSKFP